MTPKQMVEILDGQLTDCYADIAEQQGRIAALEAALDGLLEIADPAWDPIAFSNAREALKGKP